MRRSAAVQLARQSSKRRLEMMRERGSCQLAEQPHEIGRETHVKGTGANGLLVARERDGQQRAADRSPPGERIEQVRRAVARPRFRERVAERGQEPVSRNRESRSLVPQRRERRGATSASTAGCRVGRWRERIVERCPRVEQQAHEACWSASAGARSGEIRRNFGPFRPGQLPELVGVVVLNGQYCIIYGTAFVVHSGETND